MRQIKRYKWIVLFLSIEILCVLVLFLYQTQNDTNPPVAPDEIEYTKGGAIFKNRLIIFTTDQKVRALAKEFQGEIMVESGSMYKVKFPVSNFDELTLIKD